MLERYLTDRARTCHDGRRETAPAPAATGSSLTTSAAPPGTRTVTFTATTADDEPRPGRGVGRMERVRSGSRSSFTGAGRLRGRGRPGVPIQPFRCRGPVRPVASGIADRGSLFGLATAASPLIAGLPADPLASGSGISPSSRGSVLLSGGCSRIFRCCVAPPHCSLEEPRDGYDRHDGHSVDGLPRTGPRRPLTSMEVQSRGRDHALSILSAATRGCSGGLDRRLIEPRLRDRPNFQHDVYSGALPRARDDGGAIRLLGTPPVCSEARSTVGVPSQCCVTSFVSDSGPPDDDAHAVARR